MTNHIYDTMLSQYDSLSEQERNNALNEVNQQLVLAGLHSGGFFDVAALYGGTCLRIFYRLQRFSHDMSFSLLSPKSNFDFEKYFQPIIDMFALAGRNVEIKKKEKKFTAVESAFLKDGTDVYDVSFQTNKTIKIKIEVDTQPPMKFHTEPKLLLLPYTFITRCFTLPDLFAGKMHALIYRKWRNRVKGSDWYDFEWYIRNNVPLDFDHLAERVRQFNNTKIDKATFLEQLRHRLATTNMQKVKDDVLPFVKDTKELDIWSNEYFLQLVDLIRFV